MWSELLTSGVVLHQNNQFLISSWLAPFVNYHSYCPHIRHMHETCNSWNDSSLSFDGGVKWSRNLKLQLEYYCKTLRNGLLSQHWHVFFTNMTDQLRNTTGSQNSVSDFCSSFKTNVTFFHATYLFFSLKIKVYAFSPIEMSCMASLIILELEFNCYHKCLSWINWI